MQHLTQLQHRYQGKAVFLGINTEGTLDVGVLLLPVSADLQAVVPDQMK